ncbi:MAG: hypothetical protein AAF732_09610 [Pseudomonadota bacterium]
MSADQFRILAKLCDPCCDNCPTIMESADGQSVVVVGKIGDPSVSSDEVKRHIGDGEAAVIIPKSLLLEAMKTAF